MPIIQDAKLIAVINDNLYGGQIEFSYRIPTSSERVNYQNATVTRQNGKLTVKSAQTNLFYGLKILTGIREGDFYIQKERHENLAKIPKEKIEQSAYKGYATISSDETSDFYESHWKKFVEELGSHCVISLGDLVFDKAADREGKNEDDTPADENP